MFSITAADRPAKKIQKNVYSRRLGVATVTEKAFARGGRD
jgi:hypothetical protein